MCLCFLYDGSLSLQEAEEPEGQVFVTTYFKVVAGEDGSFWGFLSLEFVADTDVVLIVDAE